MQKFTITPDQARLANKITKRFAAVAVISSDSSVAADGVQVFKTVIKFVPGSSDSEQFTVQDALDSFLFHAVELREAIVEEDGHAKNTVAVNSLIRKTLKAIEAEKTANPTADIADQLVDALEDLGLAPVPTERRVAKQTTAVAKQVTARPVNHGHVVWGVKSQRFIAHVKIDGTKSRKRFLTEDEAHAYCDEIMGAPVAA
jgi:hypothetical protein